MLKTISSVTNAIGALNYKGTWNATTNTPTIVSSVGVKGDYYQVSVAGSTAINGISNWGVGDVIAFNGSTWQRIEGGADLNGVNLSVSGTTTLSGLTASTALALNAGKDVVSVTNTGTGNNVLADGPTLTTPNLGAATATSVNKVTITAPATGSTLTIADGKTLTANNSIALTGTDATTMTFPSTNATIARTDAAQTFTGDQTFAGINISSIINGVGVTGTFTRDSATATGNVSYTGVGFKPSLVVFYAGIDTQRDFMISAGTASAGRTLYNNIENALGVNNQAVAFYYRRDFGGGNFSIQSATIASMDADGFTLAYTRTVGGSGASNSIIVNYIAYK
jgi:hypothetical protein